MEDPGSPEEHPLEPVADPGPKLKRDYVSRIRCLYSDCDKGFTRKAVLAAHITEKNHMQCNPSLRSVNIIENII